MDVDDVFEKIVIFLSPIWGPFYALFYIMRLLWQQLFSRDDGDDDDIS
jgi:hypothetical protein